MATVKGGKINYPAGLWRVPALLSGVDLQQTFCIDHSRRFLSADNVVIAEKSDAYCPILLHSALWESLDNQSETISACIGSMASFKWYVAGNWTSFSYLVLPDLSVSRCHHDRSNSARLWKPSCFFALLHGCQAQHCTDSIPDCCTGALQWKCQRWALQLCHCIPWQIWWFEMALSWWQLQTSGVGPSSRMVPVWCHACLDDSMWQIPSMEAATDSSAYSGICAGKCPGSTTWVLRMAIFNAPLMIRADEVHSCLVVVYIATFMVLTLCQSLPDVACQIATQWCNGFHFNFVCKTPPEHGQWW